MIGSKMQSNISKFLQIRSGIERDQFLPLNYWGITAQLLKRPQYIQIQKLLINSSSEWATGICILEVEHIKTFCWSLNFTAEYMKIRIIRNCSSECWTPLHFIYKYVFFPAIDFEWRSRRTSIVLKLMLKTSCSWCFK